MTHTRPPVVLVTGASSGIGLALARKLWESDYRVVITARGVRSPEMMHLMAENGIIV